MTPDRLAELEALAAERPESSLLRVVSELASEIRRLHRITEGLVERVASQAALLARSAERTRPQPPDAEGRFWCPTCRLWHSTELATAGANP